MKNYSELKKLLLKDKEILRAYDELGPEFNVAKAVIGKRIEKGMTQAELAKKIGTKQSAVSRIESGNYNPSVGLLEKIAKALDSRLIISIT